MKSSTISDIATLTGAIILLIFATAWQVVLPTIGLLWLFGWLS